MVETWEKVLKVPAGKVGVQTPFIAYGFSAIRLPHHSGARRPFAYGGATLQQHQRRLWHPARPGLPDVRGLHSSLGHSS